MKFLRIIFGILLALFVAFLGFLLTNLIDHGFAVLLFISLVPFLGIYFYKSKYKDVGIGVFLGLIPLIIITLAIIGLRNAHF